MEPTIIKRFRFLLNLGQISSCQPKRFLTLAASVLSLIGSVYVQADDGRAEPRFEWGLAYAGINSAAYPSSSVNLTKQFLLPWFIYRSDKVEVKDGGIKLIAYRNDWLTIDLGAGGSLNADTSETPIRNGMPDIDFILELGPRFDVSLIDSSNANWRNRLNWESGLRLAVSSDFRSLAARGPVATTELKFQKEGIANPKFEFGASVGATWLGNRMMDYFFSVEDQFATAERPAFDAEAGYLGLDFSAGVAYRATPAVSTYLGIGYTSYEGSDIENSPLFEEKENARILLAAIWQIHKSKETVVVFGE